MVNTEGFYSFVICFIPSLIYLDFRMITEEEVCLLILLATLLYMHTYTYPLPQHAERGGC